MNARGRLPVRVSFYSLWREGESDSHRQAEFGITQHGESAPIPRIAFREKGPLRT